MQFFTTTTAILLAVAGLANAAPKPATPKPFFLRVTSPNKALNAKCVSTYHTGAGTADAVLSDCGPAPAKQWVYNGTQLAYTGYGPDGNILSGLAAYNGGASYENWGRVTIDAGAPGTIVTYNAKDGFLQDFAGLGFIACEWSHYNAYQIFALGRDDVKLPATCSPVKLLKGCYNTDPGCNA